MRLQVYRVQVNEVTETTAVPADKVETPGPRTPSRATRTVTTPGVDGQKVTRYRVTVVDGVETGREVIDTAVTVAAGHRAGHAWAPSRSPAAPAARPPTASTGPRWRKCESGGNPRAVNPAAATTGSTSSR